MLSNIFHRITALPGLAKTWLVFAAVLGLSVFLRALVTIFVSLVSIAAGPPEKRHA